MAAGLISVLAGGAGIVLGHALSAGADACPSRPDLVSGIAAVFSDGSHVEYRDMGGGLVEIFEPGAAQHGGSLLYLSMVGLYDTEMVVLDNGQMDAARWLSMTYSSDLGDLPAPDEGHGWSGEILTTQADGKVDTDSVEYEFGAAVRRRLAGCEFNAVPVMAKFIGRDRWLRQEFLYFSDLGIAVLVGRQEMGMDAPETRALRLLRVISD